MPETQAADAANRMYWESDDSVAHIAARFDLSRRALYHAVRPLAAGAACNECGGELVFENRLGRKSGSAVCPACGATRHDIEFGAVGAASTRDAAPEHAGERAAAAHGDARGGDIRQRAVLLSGAAIAGIAIGGVATWLAKRR
jgi:hypothetical protein